MIRVNRRTSGFLVVTLLTASACSSYMQIEPGDAGRYESVDVLLMDGSSVTLSGVVTEDDTLRGRLGDDTVHVSFAFSEMSKVGVRTSDADKTTALVVVGSLAFLTGALLIGWASSD